MRLQALVSNRSFLTLLFGALLVLPAFANQYTLFVANLMLLYIILASGLNILVGFAGQLAFANAAIYGIGAYGTALLQVHLGWSFWAAAPVGAVLAMVIGTLLAFPALRLSGIFLALSTLAFAQATQWVLWHWQSVTFGAGGFRAPPVNFGWIPIKPDYGIYFVSWAVTLVLLLFTWRIMRSRIGRAFVAMRDGEMRTRGERSDPRGDSLDRLDAVVHEIDLSAAIQLPRDRLFEEPVVPRLDKGEHRRPILGRRFEQREIAQAGKREMQRSRNRRGRQRQHVHTQLQRLESLLVPHAEAVLFVDDEQSEILERHVR